ncbi:AAA family ATPase [Shewanella woodyi]|uniref:AAA family ATPase n=1 Tax=Shewanella woodyi TaxID=60961 RepID=UPI003748A96B
MSFQLFNISIDGSKFEISKAIHSNKNIISVLTGKNGSGKSRILEFIASNFHVTAAFLQKYPNNWDENFNAYVGDYSDNQMFCNVNGREVAVQRINKTLACGFQYDGQVQSWRQLSPAKLICISTSPFDRFPANSTSKLAANDFYSYIGMKNTRSNNSVKSLISNVVDTMFKKPNSIDSNLDVIKTTLEYLGYGTRILVSYSKSPGVDDIFPVTLDKVALILNKLKSNTDIENPTTKEDQYEYLNEVYESILYLYRNSGEKNKKTFSIPLNLARKNILEDDYIKAIQVLSRAGIFKVKSLKLSEKTDNRRFIDFVNASSGEQCLSLMLLGVSSQIENGSLICIDEPEISLHPEWQEEFIHLLDKLFSGYQNCHFVIATHSPLIVSNLNSENCFVLDLDKNELVNIHNSKSRSSDYQLATLFKSPGFKNEYLVNESLDILSHLSRSVDINTDIRNRATLLLSIFHMLDEDDPVYSLISTIQRVMREA